jgi:tetratricopeptide (TPR) repeat protein
MRRLAAAALALGLAACATPASRREQDFPPVPAPPEARAAPDTTPPEPARTLVEELEHAATSLDTGELDEAFAAYQRAVALAPDDTELLTRAAQLAFRMGDADAAIEYATRAMQAGGADPWLRQFLAESRRAERDYAGMAALLEAPSGDPLDSEAAGFLYSAWLEKGDLERARSVARWQVDAEPETPAGWLNLAEVTEKLGDAAAAEKILREASAKQPRETQYLAAIAASRRARGDRLGELGVLNELLGRDGKDASSWLAKAEAEFDLGREADGVKSLARAEQLQPEDLRTTMRLALIDLQRGAFVDAEARLARVSELYPEQYEIAYFLGVARRRAGDAEGALTALDRIAEDHPRFSDGRVQVAGILEARGDFEGARLEVERAQAIENSKPLAYYHASLLAKGGDPTGGIAELEAMLRGGADDAETHYNIGILRGEAREFDAAIATMNEALALDPNHAGALNFIGYSWAERGERLDEAQQLIERALALRPDDGFITDSLAWVFFQRAKQQLAAGQKKAALAQLEKARVKLEEADKLTGGDPVISEHLGDVYLALGNKRSALRKYEQAQTQSPRAGEQPELAAKLERLRRELAPR